MSAQLHRKLTAGPDARPNEVRFCYGLAVTLHGSCCGLCFGFFFGLPVFPYLYYLSSVKSSLIWDFVVVFETGSCCAHPVVCEVI